MKIFKSAVIALGWAPTNWKSDILSLLSLSKSGREWFRTRFCGPFTSEGRSYDVSCSSWDSDQRRANWRFWFVIRFSVNIQVEIFVFLHKLFFFRRISTNFLRLTTSPTQPQISWASLLDRTRYLIMGINMPSRTTLNLNSMLSLKHWSLTFGSAILKKPNLRTVLNKTLMDVQTSTAAIYKKISMGIWCPFISLS
jgi:hypothetical protein